MEETAGCSAKWAKRNSRQIDPNEKAAPHDGRKNETMEEL